MGTNFGYLFKYIQLTVLMVIMVLAFQNCGEFQGSGSTNSTSSIDPIENNFDLVQKGQALYSQRCASCHGPIDTSSKMGRNFTQISNAIESIPTMGQQLSDISDQDIEAIAAALEFQAGGGGLAVNADGRLEFQCAEGVVAKTPILKLTNREFETLLTQIMDHVSSGLKNDSDFQNLIVRLPIDVITDKHGNSIEQSRLFTEPGFLGFLQLTHRAAELIAESSGLNQLANTNGCLASSNLGSSCHALFVREIGSLAFRRSLSTQEASEIAARLSEPTLDKRDQLIVSFSALLLDPEVTNKAYLRGQEVGPNLVELTSFELASKLAFFVTGAAPDQELRNLAQSGAIKQNATLSAQVDRLLNTSASGSIVRLFRESYGYDYYEGLAYDEDFADGVRIDGLEQAMNEELDRFFVDTVISQNGTFFDLMTSRHSSVNHSGLAAIYGVNQGDNLTLPPQRLGFLNRAAMLTKRSGFAASPIKRGVKVLSDVLCTDVGSPPLDAPTELVDLNGQVMTTRERTQLTSEVEGSSCVFCHSRINPLGFAYENFDSLGRVRSEEKVFDGQGREIASLPVNTNIVTEELHLKPTSSTGSTDFASKLGSDDKAMACLTQKIKRFESRVAVSPANNCQMNKMLTTLYGQGQQGSIRDAIKQLILSDEFKYWSY